MKLRDSSGDKKQGKKLEKYNIVFLFQENREGKQMKTPNTQAKTKNNKQNVLQKLQNFNKNTLFQCCFRRETKN